MNNPASQQPGNRSPWRYLGLATQLMAYLGLSVWVGIKLDRLLKLFPLLTLILPLLILVTMFYKIMRDTRQ